MLKPVFIWKVEPKKCFGFINHKWLLDNVFFIFKYKYTLTNWLKFSHIKFEITKALVKHIRIHTGGLFNSFLINLTLNGIENVINQKTINYQKIILRSGLKIFWDHNVGSYLFFKLFDESLKK